MHFLESIKNKYLGTIGDFGAFSFHASKNIVGGQCGALVINNKKFVKRADVVLDKGTNRRSLEKIIILGKILDLNIDLL